MATVLSLPYHPQQAEGYCLAACAQMVLEYWGLTHAQADLANTLRVRPPYGVRYTNVTRLSSATVEVRCLPGTPQDLRAWLARGVPVIAFVEAGELPHWQNQRAKHAVVIVGLKEDVVYLLDPAVQAEPLATPLGDFLLAWDEMDAMYAVLTRREEVR